MCCATLQCPGELEESEGGKGGGGKKKTRLLSADAVRKVSRSISLSPVAPVVTVFCSRCVIISEFRLLLFFRFSFVCFGIVSYLGAFLVFFYAVPIA